MADYSEIKNIALRIRNNTTPGSNTAILVGGLFVSIVSLLEQLEERGGGSGGGITPGEFTNLFIQNITPYLNEIENGTIIAGKAAKLANPTGLRVVDYNAEHEGPNIPVDGSTERSLPMPDKINALELILRNGVKNGIVSLDEQGHFVFSKAIICQEDVVSYGAGTGDIATVAQLIQSTIEQMKQDGQLSSGAGITSVALDYDASLYKFRVHIIDGNNTDYYSDYVDLPIETVVVNGRFDEETKKLILTLTNGSTIDISVGQIIAGLASETYVNNSISTEVTNRNSAIESAISTEVTNRNSALRNYLPLAGGTMNGNIAMPKGKWLCLSGGDFSGSYANYGIGWMDSSDKAWLFIRNYFGISLHCDWTNGGPINMEANYVNIRDSSYTTRIQLRGSSETNPYLAFIHKYNGVSYTSYLQAANGKTYIGSTSSKSLSVDANGNCVAAGEVSAYSDRRLKSNIKTLENRGALHPVSYIKDGKASIGFIAQEVRDLYPETVLGEETANEYLSLNYGALTAALQAQIIEQQKQIDELRRIVKILLEE